MARCKTCEAEILWGTTAAGKKMCLNATPVPEGQWVHLNGQVRKATPDDARLLRPLYVAHWVTCPDAPSFRTSRR